jgi:hypothetical protein
LLTRAEASAPLLPADHQKVLHRAKAWLLVQQRRFTDFKEHIQDNQFATKDHGFLQSLWNEAHYMEVSEMMALKYVFTFFWHRWSSSVSNGWTRLLDIECARKTPTPRIFGTVKGPAIASRSFTLFVAMMGFLYKDLWIPY